MFWILLKRQIAEVFKSYFYDAKKNKMRPKWAIALWIIFFIVIMVGLLGGIFTALAMSLCDTLVSLDLGWMYFLLMSIIAIMLGAFGSVFNTFASLYLSKDNDLLLPLPIPVETIVSARLANVYLLGAMYSATVSIPMLLVYGITAGFSPAKLICGILLVIIISFIVLLLSAVLGYCVARISQKLKNKSYITVIVTLAFLAAYYFFYFQANTILTSILTNAVMYGQNIKGMAYGLYLFGTIGEGNWLAAVLFTAATALICWLVWRVLVRSFLKIAASGGSRQHVRYVEKTARQKSPFTALLVKEFGRFTSSPDYMLNSGLGIILIPIAGLVLLFKGQLITEVMNELLSSRPGCVPVLFCMMLLMLSSMNDMAVSSVSLEGKSLWIPQSLPVEAKTVLRSKAAVQLILSSLPILFAGICISAVSGASVTENILLCVLALAYVVFSALFGMVIGVKMPLLDWTSELAPIKQSGAVAIVIFGSWAVSVVFAAVYVAIGYKIGAVAYMAIWTVLFSIGSLLSLHWLDTKGAEAFASL